MAPKFDYTRTFKTTRRRTLTLAEATGRHKMVADALDKMPQSAPAMMEHVWEAITGSMPAKRSPVHDAVDTSCPTEYAMILHRTESVPAAFAFSVACKVLSGVSSLDDVAIRDAMASVWQAFETRRQQANNIREGFGCDNSASWHTLRDIEQDPNSAKLSRKMQEIADLAGKMFDTLQHMRTKVPTDDPHKVVGATVGGKVERLLPSELGRLDGPTSDMQTMRILQDQAQVRKMAGEATKARGPMVLLLDESSSMHEEQYAGRGRNTWSKACAIALTRLAWSEDRAVRVVHFAEACVSQDIAKDDTRALFEMARSFLSGGTAFGYGLECAYREVGDLAAEGNEGADIVCVTDGEEYHSSFQEHADVRAHLNRTLDKMDDDEVKLWTVGIGKQHAADFPLRKRAESWVFAHDHDLASHDRTAVIVGGLADAAKANDPTTLN